MQLNKETHTSRNVRRIRGRRSSFAAIAASVALVLAGCATGDNVEGSDTPEPLNAATEKTTLSVWHYFSEDNQVAVMDGMKDIFEDANPNVTVENVYIPYDQMAPKLVSAAAADEGPDVVVFNGGDTANYVLSGVLQSLDDYWAAYEEQEQFPDGVFKRVDGSIYGVQGYVNLLGLWYNKDILDEIGVEPPTTIAELETAMEAARVAGYGGITLTGMPNGQSEWQAYPWLTSFGFDYGNPQEGPLIEGYQMVKGWVDSGYLSAEAATWDQTVPFQQFAAGGIAFAENGNWQRGTAEGTADFEWGVVPLPVLKDKGQIYLGGEGQGIGAFSKNPDLAWKYLTETYMSPEGQLLASGLAGSIPTRLDVASLPEIAESEFLSAFTATIAAGGAPYPSAEIAPDVVADVFLLGGQAWSSVIGGAATPEQAAQTLISEISRLQ